MSRMPNGRTLFWRATRPSILSIAVRSVAMAPACFTLIPYTVVPILFTLNGTGVKPFDVRPLGADPFRAPL